MCLDDRSRVVDPQDTCDVVLGAVHCCLRGDGVRAVYCCRGVPRVASAGERVVRNVERRVKEIVLACGIAHAQPLCGIGVSAWGERASVRQDQSQCTHIEIVVIFVLVNPGFGFGTRVDRGGYGLSVHVDQGNGRRNGRDLAVGTLIENRQDVAIGGQHAVAEERVSLRGFEGEDRLTFQ